MLKLLGSGLFTILKAGKNNSFALIAIIFAIYYAITNYQDSKRTEQLIYLQTQNHLLIKQLQVQEDNAIRIREQIFALTTEVKELTNQKLALTIEYQDKLEKVAYELQKHTCSTTALSPVLRQLLRESTTVGTTTTSNK